MRNVPDLRRQARRTYELGRFRTASRVGAIVVPLAILSACQTGAVVTSAVIGTSLLTVAIALRWWHRVGVESTAIGLRTGGAATVVALAVCQFAPSFSPNVALSLCVTAGGMAGVMGGQTIVRYANSDWRRWVLAVAVGALAASLGCIALGVGSFLGASLAVAVTGATASALRSATV